MKLEMAGFPVKDVSFGKKTAYSRGILTINKEELVSSILEDKKVATADVEITFPGDKTRIVRVRDVVEPRVKVSGQGCVFPGILGPVQTVGEGRDHCLTGVNVVASADYTKTIVSGTSAGHEGIIDMWGAGTTWTPFGSNINVVPVYRLADGINELEAHTAIQMTEFKVARYLAETTRKLKPEDIKVFELTKTDPSLPKVIYILGCLTTVHGPHSYVAFYGLPIKESLPTFVHPNELLDGALTQDARLGAGIRPTTYGWMNLPVVLELYKQHGKQVNFLGVIIQRTRFEAEHGKQVTASCASQLAKLLEADGVISTAISTSGSNYMDVMLTLQACEKKGIKTVIVTPEWGGKDGTEVPLIFQVPEANAVVSTGSVDRDVALEKPDKVIGARVGEKVQIFVGDQPFSPFEAVTIPAPYWFTGGADWFGHAPISCTEI